MNNSSVVEPAATEVEHEIVVEPFRGWLVRTLLLTVALCCAFVWFNIRTDFLGVHGRNDIRIHTVPRFSVYVMTYRFIPENFDGLMLGNSQAAIMDTSKIHDYKVFNGAVIWATMTEERTLAEQVLKRGHLKVAVLFLAPDLTSTHVTRSAYMTQHDYWSSYGSVQTLLIDYQVAREALGHLPAMFYDPYGRARLPLFFQPASRFAPDQLAIDPVETRDLHELVDHLHAKGVKVYVMFAPMYQAKWDAQQQELLDWQSKVLAGFAPGELEVIDLPEEVKRPLQAKRENFPDYTHLSPAGSDTVMKALDAILAEKSKSGQAVDAR